MIHQDNAWFCPELEAAGPSQPIVAQGASLLTALSVEFPVPLGPPDVGRKNAFLTEIFSQKFTFIVSSSYVSAPW
jgi:hypothetical protein